MRSFLRHAGAPQITLGLLLSLTAWYLFLNATGALSWGWGAFDLGAFRLFAMLLFGNLLAGALASVRDQRGLPRLCVYLACLFVILSGAYSYLFRFEGSVGLAEGEAYEPVPPIFRSVKRGPLAPVPPLGFTLTRVEPDGRRGRAEIVQQRVAREIGTQWEKIGSSEIRFEKSGAAPLVVVTSEEKGELERTYVKLDLDGAGKVDSFMFETLPYDFYLSRDKGKGAADAYILNVRRGKLNLYEGRVAAGQKVPVQSLVVTIGDERKLAMLTIRTSPGRYPFLASLALLSLSLLVAAAAPLQKRP